MYIKLQKQTTPNETEARKPVCYMDSVHVWKNPVCTWDLDQISC